MPRPRREGLRIRLVLSVDAALGPGKADLLEGIAETGSITRAGARLGMSYRRAWLLVGELNAMFAAPLVDTQKGGSGGGGAHLTPLGREVLARFRHVEQTAETAAAAELAALRALLRPSA